MLSNPLTAIRFNLENGHYQDRDTIQYLLDVIARMESNIDQMQLAYLDHQAEQPDPDPQGDDDCICVYRVQDDAGITLVATDNPACTKHHPAPFSPHPPDDGYTYSCTFYAHQFCDGVTVSDTACKCHCHEG